MTKYLTKRLGYYYYYAQIYTDISYHKVKVNEL